MGAAEPELGADEYVPQRRLLSWAFRNKPVPIPDDSDRKPFPYQTSWWPSKLTFWWMVPIMNVGYRRTITSRDLYKLTPPMTVEAYGARFQALWERHLPQWRQKWEQEHPDNSTFVVNKWQVCLVLIETFKRELFWALFNLFIAFSAMSVSPLVSKQLIEFVSKKAYGLSASSGEGVGYAVCSFALLLITAFTFDQYFFRAMNVGTKCKSVLTQAILEKSMRLSPHSKHRFSDAKMTSLMSTDLSRIEFGWMFVPMGTMMPIPIGVSIVILVINIGGSSMVGIAVFLVLLIVCGVPMAQLIKLRAQGSKITDERVTLTKQVLSSLKMIKFYAWEGSFLKKLVDVRTREVDVVLKMQRTRNIVTGVAMTLPSITSMVAFLVLYGLERDTRSPADMFSSVSSFEIITLFVFFIPVIMSTFTDMLAGYQRIGALFAAEDIDPYPGYHVIEDKESAVAIELTDASFKWEEFDPEEAEDEEENKKKEKAKKKQDKKHWWQRKHQNSEKEAEDTSSSSDDVKEKTPGTTFPGLRDINLTVSKGEFIIIAGAIGSGKTSLLDAISGHMTATGGTITINGNLLFCGQPWAQNATIRENIIFGLPFDRTWYDQVIYACSLQADLAILPGGDLTEVGERGITLSGGQKARLNLARSIYANPEILLMDDVLSAVDARVGRHIVDQCFMGLMKDKTRVLATHQLGLISAADRVIFLNGDGTIDVGTESELKQRNSGFEKLYAHVSLPDELDDDDDDPADPALTAPKPPKGDTVIESISVPGSESDYIDVYAGKDAAKGKIIEREEVAVNQISLDVYYQYIKHGAGKLTVVGWFICFATTLALATFCEIFTNTWLSFWVSKKWPERSDGFYIGLYVMFNILYVIFLIAAFMLLVRLVVIASRRLHLKALERVIHTPMAYIDVTPLGRMINRFTKDTDALDNEISENLRMLALQFARLIGVVVLCIVYIPWVALVVPAALIVLVCACNYYLATLREVKRLEALSRSFVYSNFTEVLSGSATIANYRHQERFKDMNRKFINDMNEATFLVIGGQRWIETLLNIFGALVSFLVAMLCVFRVFKVSAASAGLLLTYSQNLSRMLSDVTRLYAQVENEFNSAERIEYYALHLDQEKAQHLPEDPPVEEWPTHGAIDFAQVGLRYRPNLPRVLNDLTISVKGGEKVGICGRTGAGKSSIMAALYRLVGLESGTISIDGLDISSVGLHTLRSRLSIIPQDPVLFEGTIRHNLDPFDEIDDDTMWQALRRAHLVTADDIAEATGPHASRGDDYERPKFHLDATVEEDGANFSLGERQLLAFARALIRNTKVLIMDEATSSVDYDTDHKTQQTIRTEFADCTILCIAHRLKTVLEYDRILVMDRGQVAEFDTPLNLFERGGIFREMCDQAKINRSDFDHKYV
ncbi:hypothetical protein DIURU_002695 [Diutina rugosa]|uniref:Uncharacterized protein n=1 Tax=Diutina rugosa TaxID=5481 RepID=A0A642UPE2_DIURU|nr:uncharacterized protein DIURU_002695 [Diutina rugosa]KAA8902799.1 hypothetical protein DIURU_002695 [Diutina rugosa]